MPRLHLIDHHIYYEDEGDGPAVVLLHHATAALGNWRRQRQPLLDAGYRVIAYDRHGFGRADPLPAWGLDYHDEGVDELIALLDALEVARPALIGHSDGATISLMAAARHPGRVAAVVAEAPHMWVDEGWLEPGFETFRRTVMQQDRFWQSVARDHGEQGRQVVERWRQRWLDPAFRAWDVSPCLPQIRCPILVIHGETDLFFPVAHSRRIAASVTAAEFWLIPDVGHTPHLESSLAFNHRLLAFLQRCYPSNP